MKRKIHTDQAPQAIGPYSQAIRLGDLLFSSGQIPLDPANMQIVEGDITRQTAQVIKNLEAVLKAAGTDFSKVVKTTVYLKSMDDFKAFNTEYGKVFPSEGTPPARTTIQAAALPMGALVEIEVVAAINDG